MVITSPAIVLHSRKFGDTSRIVVLYTQQLGKVSVVAKGARKPKSPFGSALEPLSVITATFYHRRHRDLHTVSMAELISVRKTIQSDLDAMTSAMLVTETVLRTQKDEQPDPGIWEVLCDGLELMDTTSSPYALSVNVRLALAECMGFGLPGERIGTSQGVKPTVVSINPVDGLPRPEHAAGIRMSGAAYARLCEFCVVDDAANAGKVGEADQLEIESFITSYFSYHLDKNVASRAFTVLST
jgi:DNA repair protein RecO (recombination protein O)